MSLPELDPATELLLDEALDWLEPDQSRSVQGLVAADPGLARERDAWSRAAAMAALALGRDPTPPPVALQRRLQGDALAFLAQRGQARVSDLVRPAVALPARHPSGMRPAAALPWLAAAAAVLFALWLTQPTAPAPMAARAQLLSSGTPHVRWEWQTGPSPLAGAVTGDVVWSDDRQQGFLRLRGLPALDPDRQYQLWIVDGTRTGAPVDGGLFDLPTAQAECIVPITAKLPVRSAAAFVVTVEPAGGVVVSGQEHVVALAKP